jgi:TPP-dependent trihydroxycyclohexane-1,2-dione (THcHDO) dehydratase
MSELDELAATLIEQEKKLHLIIAEAEAKKNEYLKTIADGRVWLKRVEDILEIWKTKECRR